MPNFKRLANMDDELIEMKCPIPVEDIDERKLDYNSMSAKEFLSKHRQLLFKSVQFTYKGKEFSIQHNHCLNPLCKWFGKNQEELPQKAIPRKKKTYRYRLSGSPNTSGRVISCNPDPTTGTVGGCYVTPVSNWSVAEEIRRLVKVNSIADVEPEYQFHKAECPVPKSTPSINPEHFRGRGKSKTNSKILQCKHCGKRTSLLPQKEQSYSYHQKRNEIIPTLAKLFVNRVPVKRACEILDISPPTYYRKLEYVYMRCLEFLETYETKPLGNMDFESIWINTDSFMYNLNNIRQKFAGGPKAIDESFRKLQTHIVVSGDAYSRYIFRSDIAYDWEITREQLETDTELYKCDHLEAFERKNARLRYSHVPQPPTEFDKKNSHNYSEESAKYSNDKAEFDKRFNYVQGLNTSTQYTAIAHFWLIKQMINAKEWFFISDKDQVLINSIFRVFKDEVASGYANYFLCLVDDEKKAGTAMQEFNDSKKRLEEWRDENLLSYNESDYNIALNMLTDAVRFHKFYDKTTDSHGSTQLKRTNRAINHPLATNDLGYRKLDILTDLSGLNAQQLAELLIQVNNRATDGFMQQIRRRISVLERPLVTAKAGKKSYIYANFNPQYAQYLVTILRTYYNFCCKIKGKTPAQRLGIANKQYKFEDILYDK